MNEQTNTAEFREERADMLYKVAKRVEANLEGPIESANDRMHSLLSLGGQGFIDTIASVNRILTKNHTPSEETGYYANRELIIGDVNRPGYVHLFPSIEDKEPLMGYLYGKLVEMYQSDADPGHIAAVLGQGINAIHPFNDANGRTARAMHAIVTTNISSGDGTLFKERGMNSLKNTDSLSPELFEQAIYDQMKHAYSTHIFKDGAWIPKVQMAASSEVLERIQEDALRDTPRGKIVETIASTLADANVGQIVAGMLDQSPHINEHIKRSINFLPQHGVKAFMFDAFYPRANYDDLTQMANIVKDVNKIYVVTLIDALSGPASRQQFPLRTNEFGVLTVTIAEAITKMASQAISRVPAGS